MRRRTLSILFLLSLLALTVVPSGLFGSDNNALSGDAYYKAVSQLVSSQWKDTYFHQASLRVGDYAITIDDRIVELESTAEISSGEIMLPVGVLDVLGIQVGSPKNELLSKASPVNNLSVIPISTLNKYCDAVYNEYSETIIITNEFQMARLSLKLSPGSPLPNGLNATQQIAGPNGLYVLQFNSASEAKTAYQKLKDSPNVVYVVPDTLVTLDNAVVDYDYTSVINTYAPANHYSHLGWGPYRIGTDQYMDYLISSGKQFTPVVVAVLDTGIDSSLSFFTGRTVPGYNFVDNDHNPYDAHGHGTHVSGTIIDTTIAMPNIRIMPVKVLNDSGSGSGIIVMNAVRWATDNNAQAINMSLGGFTFGLDESLDESLSYATSKNTTIVVSAGNSSADSIVVNPARSEYAITVSAFNIDDNPASFTNFGMRVDVAAPGVNIHSTHLGGATKSFNGTSMASPHVAAAVALLLANDPTLTPSTLKAIICQSVDPIASKDNYYGTGILNLAKATGFPSQFIYATPSGIFKNVGNGAKQEQLTIMYHDKGVIKDVTAHTNFTSSNQAIATVNGAGLVTIHKAGKTEITATLNEMSIQIQVFGLDVIPLRVVSSTPEMWATNVSVPLTTISVTFNHSNPNYYGMAPFVQWSLTDSQGQNVDSYSMGFRNNIGDNYFTLYLFFELSPNTTYTFSIPVGGAYFKYGILEEAYILFFATGAITSVDSISLLPSSETVEIGRSSRIEMIVETFPKEASPKLNWSYESAEGGSIIIDLNRNDARVVYIQGVSAGIVTVTATAENGVSASITISVLEQPSPESIQYYYSSDARIELAVNNTRNLNCQISPMHAINTVYWSSSDISVVRIVSFSPPSSTGNIRFCQVAGVSIGSATITATTINGLSLSFYVTVIPEQLTPAGIMLSRTSASLNVGDYSTLQLVATVLPFNANNRNVTWKSWNESIATVDDNGIVTAQAQGNVIITAMNANGNIASCMVTITLDPRGLSLEPNVARINVNTSLFLKPRMIPIPTSNSTIHWSSSDISIAHVSSTGIVTGVGPGTATITASTFNGHIATCIVTVYPLVSVLYDANGGEGGPSIQTIMLDSPITIAEEKPTRSGYTFRGWGLESTSNTVAYHAGDHLHNEEDTVLYAVWTKSLLTYFWQTVAVIGASVFGIWLVGHLFIWSAGSLFYRISSKRQL